MRVSQYGNGILYLPAIGGITSLGELFVPCMIPCFIRLIHSVLQAMQISAVPIDPEMATKGTSCHLHVHVPPPPKSGGAPLGKQSGGSAPNSRSPRPTGRQLPPGTAMLLAKVSRELFVPASIDTPLLQAVWRTLFASVALVHFPRPVALLCTLYTVLRRFSRHISHCRVTRSQRVSKFALTFSSNLDRAHQLLAARHRYPPAAGDGFFGP